MRKYLLPIVLLSAGAAVVYGCASAYSTTRRIATGNALNIENPQKIVCFNPEILPDVEEVKQLSYQTFFGEVSNKISRYNHLKMLRVETPFSYDHIDSDLMREICKNNEAKFAIVPKIKYFKVGIGKYVFSNQVVVSMKVYDAQGQLLSETSHDTYRKNKKILGSTENFIKTGTEGVMNDILKTIKQNLKKTTGEPTANSSLSLNSNPLTP
ncbi:pyruvate decarboxylase [Bergeyella sp. RCAD1439]|uniref:pyruvate decarboxylase n=1 Tax=Bergeyella anatis TaxID=3113737 RepID=UPI002E18C96E|nr:pyruvate decarboxylase [Bergeyella sp. RCAD1439]